LTQCCSHGGKGLRSAWLDFFALRAAVGLIFCYFLSLKDRLAKISPVGESLSFVSAKESNQRKTDPGYARKPV
jgi:hypothetical protein